MLLESFARSGICPESCGLIASLLRADPEIDHLVVTCTLADSSMRPETGRPSKAARDRSRNRLRAKAAGSGLDRLEGGQLSRLRPETVLGGHLRKPLSARQRIDRAIRAAK
jgi:hypothetical protein